MNAGWLLVPAITLLPGCRTENVLRRLDPSWNRMQVQPRYDPYGESPFFPDRMTMREPPAGTSPHREPEERGAAPGEGFPVPITRRLLLRGRGEFETRCAPCHGPAGDGRSVVARFMARKPPAFDEARLRVLSPARIEAVIRDGYGFMPAYRAEMTPDDRWAVVAYVRALQRSRHAVVVRLPANLKRELAGAAS
ncbi:MAG TPA: cytochrome c [Polyangiaceae bacterium]|nr:cytochrome c [Polyangiaceae bacterium]